MEIHGLRLYPQTVRTVRGIGAPIYIHDRLRHDCSDFMYIFRRLAPRWMGHTFVSSFGITIGEDPMPDLRNQFGPSLIDAELDGQLMFLSGDDFSSWADRYPEQCQYLLIFREIPMFDIARRIFWDIDSHLPSDAWPHDLRAVLHCWDDIYWQLFSADGTDIDALINAHDGDPRLKMFLVDFDREYPDPSNEELQPAHRQADP
jgi:hypothetical protein